MNKLLFLAIALVATIGIGTTATTHVMAQSSKASTAAYNNPPVLAGANGDSHAKDFAPGQVASNDGTSANQANPASFCDTNCGNH